MTKQRYLFAIRGFTTIAIIAALTACFTFRPSTSALTTTPSTMNFQGRLLDSAGVPKADGLYNMKLALYTVASGGTASWTETREVSGSDYRVQVTGGLFSIQLGQRTALPASLFASGNLYFEITLATPATASCNTTGCATWESPLSPRHPLATSAYAYNAETLDGLDSSALGQLAANNIWTGQNVFGSSVNQAQIIVKAASGQTAASPLITLTDNASAELARISLDTNQNMGMGHHSLYSLTSGWSNVGYGWATLSQITSGVQNTGVGAFALQSSTTGNNNSAFGDAALQLSTTASGNSAFGSGALLSTTTGGWNTAVGSVSANSLTTGEGNAALGHASLINTTTGHYNTAIGDSALMSNVTGLQNTALGYRAGHTDSSGVFSTLSNLQNATAIGAFAQVQQSNSIVLGSVDNWTRVGIGTTVPYGRLSVAGAAAGSYTAGTAGVTTAGTTVTGTGTSWDSSLVGDQFIFANGQSGIINAVASATSLTLDTSQPVTSVQAYRIHTPGLNVTDDGRVAIGKIYPDAGYALNVQGYTKISGSIDIAGGINVGGYITSNTVETYNGQWTRLGRCTINIIYDDCRSSATILTIGDAGFEDRAEVDWRVKQQNPLGDVPYIALTLRNTTSITTDDIRAITVTNSTSQTVVELWGRLNHDYSTWSVSPQVNTGGMWVEWMTEQGFQPTLPAGTQTAPSYGTITTTKALVQSTNDSALQVQNAGGVNVMTVDTQNTAVNMTGSSLITSNWQGSGTTPVVVGGVAIDGAYAGSRTVTTHASTKPGDLILLSGYIEPADQGTATATYGTPTAPAGFTLVPGYPINTNDNAMTTLYTHRQYLWYKYATTTGSESLTVSAGTSSPWIGLATVTVRGAATSGNPFADAPSTAVIANDTAGVTATPSVSLNLSGTNNLVLWIEGEWDSGTRPIPAGYTDVAHGTHMQPYIASQTYASSGSTGAVTAPRTGHMQGMSTSLLSLRASSDVFGIHGSNGETLISVDAAAPGGTLTVTGQSILGGAADQPQVVIKAAAGQSAPLMLANSATGMELLRLQATADGNTAFGREAGMNTTGSFNTVFGSQALSLNTTGSSNTAIGEWALNSSTGDYNVAVGSKTLGQTTTGGYNTSVGTYALYNNTTGYDNVSLGVHTLHQNITGIANTAIGAHAGHTDSSGGFKTLAGLQNTASFGAYSQVQQNDSIVLGSVDLGISVGIGTTKPNQMFSVSPRIYYAGTASQSGTTVTGVGTTWGDGTTGPVYVGDTIIFADGTSATITGAITNTTLVVGTSQTVTSQAYRIHRGGFNVTSMGNAYLKQTNTAAFQVQNATGVSLFTADTSNMIIKIAGTTTTFATLMLDNAHFKATQTTAPTIAISGCTTSASSVTAGSTDSAGSFSITASNAAACALTVTFNKSYGTAPKSVVVTPKGTSASATVQPYVSSIGTNNFVLTFTNNSVNTTVYTYSYWVIE